MRKRHGMYRTRVHTAWRNMRQRCSNIHNKAYCNYGGRGIKVVAEWEDFVQFYKDMGDPPIGYTIERIDNEIGYSKENCKWATRREQALNKRMQCNNKSGFEGICFHKNNKKWQSNITLNRKQIYIGSFLTLTEAVEARDKYIVKNKMPHRLRVDGIENRAAKILVGLKT